MTASVVRTTRTTAADVDSAVAGCIGPKRSKSGAETRSQRRLAVGAEDQARQRDADLGGGDVAVELARIFENRKDPRCEHVSVFGKPAQPAASGADRRELRRDVQPGEQDEQGDDRPRQQHARGSYCKTAVGPELAGSAPINYGSASHSLRSATIGSTCEARRAGASVAARATSASSAATAANVAGSVGADAK